MIKLVNKLLLFVLVLNVFSTPAFATSPPVSTVNPNVPAFQAALTSAMFRSQFSATYNDINALWTYVYNIPSGGGANNDASLLTQGTLNAARLPAFSGDITTSAGSSFTTLASVVSAGTVGSATNIPILTYDAKGRITGVNTAAISIPSSAINNATISAGATISGGNTGDQNAFSSVIVSGQTTVTSGQSTPLTVVAGSGIVVTTDNTAKSVTITSSGGSVNTSGSPASGNIAKFTGGATISNGDLSGDITTSGTLAATLATVNSTTGAFGTSTNIPALTVNGKGLVTNVVTNPVIAPAGTLTGTTLAANVVTSSLTSLGTIATGVWNGTAIGDTYISSASTWNAKQAAGNYLTALTGDVTASGPGSAAATIAANAVTNAKMATMVNNTMKGNISGITATPTDISLTSLKSALSIALADITDLSSLTVSLSTQATGTLQAAQEPAHTGDVTNTAGSLATTISANAVTNAKMATMATATFKGNVSGSTATPSDLTVAQMQAGLFVPHPGTGLKVVIVGDSETANNTGGGGANSPNVYVQNYGFFNQFLSRVGWGYSCVAGKNADTANLSIGCNAGVGGNTSAQILTRFPTDVIAKHPDIVEVLQGTNSVHGGDGTTCASVSRDIDSEIAQTQAIGAQFWIHTIWPRNNVDGGGGSDFTANERLIRDCINTSIRAKATVRGVVVFNDDRRLANSAGDMITGDSFDGLHINGSGAYAVSDEMVEDLYGQNPPMLAFNADPRDLYDATYNPYGSVLTNGVLAGSSGAITTGVTGTVANNLTCKRLSGTDISAVGSQITKVFGQNSFPGQRLVVTTTGAGGTGEQIRCRFNSDTVAITTAAANGVWMDGSMMLRVSASSGTHNVNAEYLQVSDQSSGGWTNRTNYLSGHGYDVNIERTGVWKLQPIQLQGTSGYFVDFIINADANVANTFTVDLFGVKVHPAVNAPTFN